MPYKIIKNRNQNTYRVVNKETGVVRAKATTKENAVKQVRLLNFIDHHKY